MNLITTKDRSPTRPHLTRAEAKEYERVEAIADAETRQLEYMMQIDGVIAEAAGTMPALPLFLRGATAQERKDAWDVFTREHGYTSSRAFTLEPERRAIDPSTERFLAQLAREEEAARLRNGGTTPEERETKRTLRAAASERRQRRMSADVITVQSIAEELKMIPRDARQILRNAKIPKPEIGWAGDATWAAMIRDVLTKAPAKGTRNTSGEARAPRGKRKAKRVPLKPGDLVGSSKAKVTKDITQPPPPKFISPIDRHNKTQLTTNKVFIREVARTEAQIKSAAKRAAKRAKEKTAAKKASLPKISDAKRTKVQAKRAKAGKRK